MFLQPNNKLVDIIFSNLKIVFLLFVFLIIGGAVALSQMQRQGFPDVAVNIAGVTVAYPNASAEQVEDQVLKPLESVISDLDTVDEYQSVAGDSFGSIFITFDQKADLDAAIAELKNEVTSVSLPDDANEPKVQKYSAGGLGDFVVAVSGYTDVEDLYVEGKNLKSELEQVDGVNKVTAVNELTPEVVITFDEEKLSENGLTRSQVEEVISLAQLSLPAGSITENGQTIGVILQKDVQTVEDLKTLTITEDVQLKDVAVVKDRLNNNDAYNRIGFTSNGEIGDELRVERALLYAVDIGDDADILTVAEQIDELTDTLTDEAVDEDATYVTVYSQADSTKQQIEEITGSIFGSNIEALGPLGFIGYLVGGVGLVVILLLIFMNLRVAIMAALSIPLSLFFSAIYLYFSGIDLNTLVLFSMVLAVGLVVDPTIVFLESMQRFKSQGLSGREAAAKTVQTVGLGVFLAVATNILVFVPFGVVSGFFGEIIKYIPATIIPAMIASMVIPVLFFMPFASKILSSKKLDWSIADADLAGTWKLARWIGNGIKWLLGPGKMKFVLRIAVFVFGISLPFLVGGALVGSGAVEVVQFSEQDDSDYIILNADITDEWTFDRAAEDVAVPVQELLQEYPEIKNFTYLEQSGNSYSMLITLFSVAEREEEEMRTSDELSEDINADIAALRLNADVEASTSSEGPPQEEYPVRIRLIGDDADVLAVAVEDIKGYLNETEGIDEVKDNISEGNSGGSVTFVLDNANALNTNPFFAYSVLSNRLAENELTTLTLDGDDYSVITEMSPEISSVRQLMTLEVATPEQIAYEQQLAALEAQGVVNPEKLLEEPEEVRVDHLLDRFESSESTTIQRINGQRYVEVYASVDDDADALQIQTDLEEYLDADKLVSLGLDEDAADFKGEADSIAQSFTDLFIALAIAIFMIYVLLVGFFRSFTEPFIILFAIPLGLVGVFASVALTTGQLGFLELLGVVAMAGIVVNVTILLIDYANQLQRNGRTAADAISAAVAVRFRPIILTQLTAFGSLIPLVYLSPFWKGLAAAIIFGIISSALLSLFVTPILYLWANSVGERIAQVPVFFRKLVIAYKSIK